MERKSVLRSVTGAITCAAAGNLTSPAFSEAATLVVSRPNGHKWRRTEAARDNSCEAV